MSGAPAFTIIHAEAVPPPETAPDSSLAVDSPSWAEPGIIDLAQLRSRRRGLLASYIEMPRTTFDALAIIAYEAGLDGREYINAAVEELFRGPEVARDPEAEPLEVARAILREQALAMARELPGARKVKAAALRAKLEGLGVALLALDAAEPV